MTAPRGARCTLAGPDSVLRYKRRCSPQPSFEALEAQFNSGPFAGPETIPIMAAPPPQPPSGSGGEEPDEGNGAQPDGPPKLIGGVVPRPNLPIPTTLPGIGTGSSGTTTNPPSTGG